MLYFILQTIAFQLFFLIIYDVFLKKETFFNWNRAYLLVTALLSIVLPFIKIDSFKEAIPHQFIIQLPEVILGSLNQAEPIFLFEKGVEQTSGFVFTWQLFFVLGITIAFLLFSYKLIKIAVLIYRNPKHWKGDLLIIKLINSNAAFSFFHYVFLGEWIVGKDKDTILKHENIHVQHKHSIDLLLFEILRILFWFNPLVYMYQSRIRTLHEFIADAKAVKSQNKSHYYENLLAQVFETQNVSFINTFFKKSLIKKRIVMLTKSKSKQILKLKFMLLIPIVLGMLVYTSCIQETIDKNEKEVLDLSQYTYTLKLGEKEMSAGNKKIHNKYEAFLKTHLEYVSWTHIDRKNITINYSVHNVNEKVPEGFSKSEISFPDGSSYVAYFNWGKPDTPKKLSEEELLKLKEKYTNTPEVPFAVIDEVPIYPGCENLSTNVERRKCMSDSINKKVQKKFNTDLAVDLGLKGRQRINTIFKIDKNGNITGIRSRAPHPDLEAEAIRVISLLPKMIPGKHKGKNVIVPYSLPIVFQVQE